MKKRMISLILAATLLACGCGSAKTAEESTNDSEKETAESSDPVDSETKDNETAESDFSDHITVEISMWEMDGWGNDEIADIIEEKFNCDIEIVTQEWSDYQEKFAALAAADQLPDSFAGYPATESWFPQFVNDELIREIPLEMLEKYPNVYASCQSSEVWNTLNDLYGGIYSIMRPYSASGMISGNINGFMYRTDWAEAVGVTEVPTDMDALYDMLYKFVTEDPDGNGQNDTYGIIGGWMDMCQYFDAYPMNNLWVELDDGTYTIGWLDEEPMVEALSWMRKAYENGVLDPEFSEDRTKWTQGIFGAYYRQLDTYWLQYYYQEWEAAYPEKGAAVDYLQTTAALSAHAGEDAVVRPYLDTSGTVFAYDTTDEEMERLLAIYDWLLSDEGNLLRYCGIEGEDYTVDDSGNVTKLHNDSLREKYPSIFIQNWPSWDHDYNILQDTYYGDEYKAIEYEVVEAVNSATENSKVSLLASFTSTDERRNFVFDYSAKLTSIITGTEDVAQMYADFVAEAEANGVREVVESVNAALAK